MAHLYRLIAYGVLAIGMCWLMLAPLQAHAYPATETPGSCNTPGGCTVYSWSASWAGSVGPTSNPLPSAACPSFNGRSYTAPSGNPYGMQAGETRTVTAANVSGNDCALTYTSSRGGCCGGNLPAGRASGTLPYTPPTYSCPNGGTLSGTSCNCPSGQQDTGTACVDPLEAACTALNGQVSYVTIGGSQNVGGTACHETGCTVTMGSPLIRARTQGGTWVTEGEATFTGATCNATAPSAPAAEVDSCPNGQPGQVNGQDVCIPYTSSDEVVRETGSTQETTTPSGTTTSTSTSTTSCTGSSCTTTVTTNVSVNGGPPTTTTTETTEPRDDYCTQNPRSPQCRESAFTGSCAGGFTCTGDAVQCATARELHAISCGLNAESDEGQLYAAESNPAGGPADIPSSTVALSPGSLDASNALGVAACLADLPITVAGYSVTLPLSDVCPALEYLRLILLAVGWLMAFRIVAKG